MIFGISIGNSNISFGLLEEGKVLKGSHIPTDVRKTEFEYALDFLRFFKEENVATETVTDIVLASVVPSITIVLIGTVKRIFKKAPIILSSEKCKSLVSHLEYPKSLGSNLLADALAMRAFYTTPSVFIDMATSTAIGILNKRGEYLGGVLLPGMQSSLDALTENAAALKSLRVEKADSLIGKNTVSALQSGALYGNAAMIDGLLDKIQAECLVRFDIKEEMTYVLTGRISHLLIPYLNHKVISDETLTLRGLWVYYEEKKGQESL